MDIVDGYTVNFVLKQPTILFLVYTTFNPILAPGYYGRTSTQETAIKRAVDVQGVEEGRGRPQPAGVQSEGRLTDPHRVADAGTAVQRPPGWNPNTAVTIFSPVGRYMKDKELAQATAGYLQRVGVRADVQMLEWSVFPTGPPLAVHHAVSDRARLSLLRRRRPRRPVRTRV